MTKEGIINNELEIEIVDEQQGSIRYLQHGWPSKLIRWHAHAEFELHLILETEGRAFIGDYIGRFEPGQLYLIGSHLPHNWLTDFAKTESVTLRDMLIQFDHRCIQSIQQIYPEFNQLRVLIDMAKSGILFYGFDQNKAKSYFKKIKNEQGIKRLLPFFEFLLSIAKWENKKLLSQVKIASHSSKQAQNEFNVILEFINQNYNKKILQADLAHQMQMNESAFSNYFFKMTGNTFSKFLTAVRIHKACKLLETTELKTATIAELVGYNNIANFHRHFLKTQGTQPLKYRQQVASQR